PGMAQAREVDLDRIGDARAAILRRARRALAAELDPQHLAAGLAERLEGHAVPIGDGGEALPRPGPAGHHRPRWTFAEELHRRRRADAQVEVGTAPAPHGHLRERHSNASRPDVLRGGHETRPDAVEEERL